MKPGRWWRAQDSCVDSPKLIKLSDRAHRNWFNLNCLASANNGVLPSLEDIAIKLRMTEARAAATIAELVTKRLYDQREDGTFAPHDWNEWQFRTDASDPTNAIRQKKFREKHREEIKELRALRDTARSSLRNGVRNGVTSVIIKRPETETDITTTASVERKGLGGGEYAGTPEFKNSLSRFKQ